MLKLFKQKQQIPEFEERFRIGNYTLTIDHLETIIEIDDNEIIDLTIQASDKEFEKLTENDDFEFSWALYPPSFYLRGAIIGRKKQLIIKDNYSEDYEVGFYLMDHFDVKVKIDLINDWITVEGEVNIDDEIYPVEIRVKNNNRQTK